MLHIVADDGLPHGGVHVVLLRDPAGTGAGSVGRRLLAKPPSGSNLTSLTRLHALALQLGLGSLHGLIWLQAEVAGEEGTQAAVAAGEDAVHITDQRVVPGGQRPHGLVGLNVQAHGVAGTQLSAHAALAARRPGDDRIPGGGGLFRHDGMISGDGQQATGGFGDALAQIIGELAHERAAHDEGAVSDGAARRIQQFGKRRTDGGADGDRVLRPRRPPSPACR